MSENDSSTVNHMKKTGWTRQCKGWRLYAAQISLEALKESLNAKFVPLSVLGSFALPKKKKNPAGRIFESLRIWREKPQEQKYSVQCQIQEKTNVRIESFFFLCNTTEKNKETQNKRLSHHCLPIKKIQKYRTNNVIFLKVIISRV